MRLFALEGSEQLGQAVAGAMHVELDPLEEREFGDGEHKSRPLISVRNEEVYVLHSLAGSDGRSAADRLLRLLFFIATCRDNGAARVTAIVPYLAFMRKDQQTKPRDPVSSRYVAQLLEAVGTGTVIGLEVHNPAAFQNAFRCQTLHLDMRHAFASRIRDIAAGGRIVLASPDSGGMRRTHLLQETLEAMLGQAVGTAMMEKHRSGGVVTGDLFAGDVADAAVFIIDDMIATGGTMLRTALACRDRGAASVYAVATHGLFSAGSSELFASAAFDRILVTDSVALPASPPETAGKLEIVSCAPLLAEAIQRLHGGGSIHRLLNPRL